MKLNTLVPRLHLQGRKEYGDIGTLAHFLGCASSTVIPDPEHFVHHFLEVCILSSNSLVGASRIAYVMLILSLNGCNLPLCISVNNHIMYACLRSPTIIEVTDQMGHASTQLVN